jgi:hypothetical protein
MDSWQMKGGFMADERDPYTFYEVSRYFAHERYYITS